MNKTIRIVLPVAALLLSYQGYVWLTDSSYSDELSQHQHSADARNADKEQDHNPASHNHHTATALITAAPQQEHNTQVIEASTLPQAKPPVESGDVNVGDDSWCARLDNLTQEELEARKEQYAEWQRDIGDIRLPNPDLSVQPQNTYLLEPYAELDTSVLISHAKNDDKYALLTLLQRPDTPLKIKSKVAKHLIVLGSASRALSHIAMTELIAANDIYHTQGQVTKEVKQHILRSLVYVEFGLDRMDTDALSSYLTQVRRYQRGMSALDIEQALSEEDLARLDKMKQSFVAFINNKRAAKHLEPINSEPLPDIAQSKFDSSLAFLHFTFGELITASRNLTHMSREVTTPSACSQYILTRIQRNSSVSS